MIDLGIRCSEIGCAIPTIFHNLGWVTLIILFTIGIIIFREQRLTTEGEGKK